MNFLYTELEALSLLNRGLFELKPGTDPTKEISSRILSNAEFEHSNRLKNLGSQSRADVINKPLNKVF